jgi:hypothetical protein
VSKYTRYERQKEERPWKIHPVWRGIGCFILLIIPVIAYAAAKEFLAYNAASNLLSLPEGMVQPIVIEEIRIPYIVYPISFKWLAYFSYADFLFTAAFAFVGFGIFTVGYAFFFRMMRPSRYGRFDSAPLRMPKRRRY